MNLSTDRLTFRQYLQQQAHREDLVGDLVRDLAETRRLPRRLTPRTLLDHLERRGASDGAIVAAEVAWRQFDDYRDDLRRAVA